MKAGRFHATGETWHLFGIYLSCICCCIGLKAFDVYCECNLFLKHSVFIALMFHITCNLNAK